MCTKSKILSLKDDVYKLIEKTDEVVEKLNGLADEVDKTFDTVKKTKIAGAATAIGGGILAGAGFALSFFTFGAPLALVAAGAAFGTAGGVTVAIAEIVNAIKSSSKWREAQNALKEYESLRNKIKSMCLEIGDDLKQIGDVDLDFKTFVELVAVLVFGVSKAGTRVLWGVIANPIRISLQVAGCMRSGGVKATIVAARAASGTVTHVAAGVIGLLMMPLDIYTLVDSSIDLYKNNPHQVAVDIRNVAVELNKNKMTKDAIENHFQIILQQLSKKTKI